MKIENNMATDVKIAYIGGGSRGWAWGLMSDLASSEGMSGDVYLYDIDLDAAKANEIIGNKYNDLPDAVSKWGYHAVETIDEALTGANFVVISILPGTFDEMESDVHAPEKYGIYQPVGDTTGPGGVVRALRTIPMFEVIAKAIEKNCPDAWVINYTNPMAICVNTLYKTFPGIKAFGCCHEVFGTQRLLATALEEATGIKAERDDITVNVVGVNHFTWLTSAQYKNIDLFPIYKEFCEKHYDDDSGKAADDNWANKQWQTTNKVKKDLFLRYGVIAAAGDRHLAEFCEKEWYLKDVEMVEKKWNFGLTAVKWRKQDMEGRLAKSKKLISGEQAIELKKTGEEGVRQMKALLGLGDLVTNINLPNVGQIENLPLGVVVETNAVFRADSATPVMAGPIPERIYPLIARNAGAQAGVVKAGIEKNIDLAFDAFCNDPLVDIPVADAKELFNEMIENTKKYLDMYEIK